MEFLHFLEMLRNEMWYQLLISHNFVAFQVINNEDTHVIKAVSF